MLLNFRQYAIKMAKLNYMYIVKVFWDSGVDIESYSNNPKPNTFPPQWKNVQSFSKTFLKTNIFVKKTWVSWPNIWVSWPIFLGESTKNLGELTNFLGWVDQKLGSVDQKFGWVDQKKLGWVGFWVSCPASSCPVSISKSF